MQDTVGVAGGEVLRVHSLAEGELPGERPLGPFGDNDLPAVAIVKGVVVSRPGPGSLTRGTHVRPLHLPPDNARHRDHHEHGYEDDDRADEDHGRLPPVTLGHLGRRRRLIPGVCPQPTFAIRN